MEAVPYLRDVPAQPQDAEWMQLAIAEARKAEATGEVPVGAVLVHDGKLIATGYNQPIGLHDPSAHAEMMALRAAGQALQNYRLPDCDLYVTLEPCAMCAGAIMHARIRRVIFGASDHKTGVAGSVTNLFEQDKLNHHTQVTRDVMADECVGLLRSFFAERRRLNKQKRAEAAASCTCHCGNGAL
jgi:tRNA(adenine34) deaminase